MQAVCSALLLRGQQRLLEVEKSSGLALDKLKPALLVLLQHSLVDAYKVTAEAGSRSASISHHVYRANVSSMLHITRSALASKQWQVQLNLKVQYRVVSGEVGRAGSRMCCDESRGILQTRARQSRVRPPKSPRCVLSHNFASCTLCLLSTQAYISRAVSMDA